MHRLHRSTEQIFSIPRYRTRGIGLAAALACAVVAAAPEARAEYAPRVAIVMCQATQAADWFASDSSSQALVGLAGLVGVPYHTLSLAQYLAEPNPDYTSVWLGDCSYIAEHDVRRLSVRLREHLDAGGSLFLSSPLGTFYTLPGGDTGYRAMDLWFPYLGVIDHGWQSVDNYRIHTTASGHAIASAAGYPGETLLTQGLESGIDVVGLSGDAPGEVLLEMVSDNPATSYPYLVVTEPVAGARVAAVGSYGTYAGPATPFRNDEPAGFHDNQLLPYLVHALLWLVGPENQPFAGVQLSHAPMTAIGRLDGDWSDEAWAIRATLEYLIELGEDTGLATVYGIVSAFADEDDWDVFHELGPELERLGGSIGSHSHHHDFNMSDLSDEQEWQREVADSLQHIRDALTRPGYAPAAMAFINPGNTIQSRDYRKFFRDIELYMTHGFETTPYASGVMGFDLPPGIDPRPVINNSPVPDYQWLYNSNWIYTVAEAAGFQAMLLDYYQHTVGRGVLYNQMWHDYAIAGAAPLHYPDTESTLPLFDVHSDHFATERVYMPSIAELVGKMHIAHGIGIATVATDQELVVSLDYTAIRPSHRDHAAGMGVRVNGSSRAIHSVAVDGEEYHAFTADTVIVPPVRGVTQTLSITLGAAPDPAASGPRLTFLSKPFQAISGQESRLDIELRDPGQFTRFCIAGPRSTVILGASEYRRSAGGELCGHLAHGSAMSSISARVVDTGDHDLAVVAVDRIITAAAYHDHTVSFEFAAGDEGRLDIASTGDEAEAFVNGEPGQVTATAGGFTLTIPRSSESLEVTIRLLSPCVDGDGDGVSTCAGDCDDQDVAVSSDCSAITDVTSDAAGCGCTVAPRRDDGPVTPGALWVLALMAVAALRRRRRTRP